MSDFLLDMGQKPWFRTAVKQLGLPLPVPQQLARESGPWQEKFLQGKSVLVQSSDGVRLKAVVEQAGGDEKGGSEQLHALVYDLRGTKSIDDLVGLYEFFHSNVRRIGANGRAIVIAADPAGADNAEAAAVASAARGFVKSLAKEIGKKGATANAIEVAKGAEALIDGPLRFLLSARSAYVDGQVLGVRKSKETAKTSGLVKPLEGQVALVTGAGRGIGADTARRLAAEGAKVIALDIAPSKDELDAVAQEIGAQTLLLDVTAKDAPQKILKAADKLGGLDIVINNAGITRDKTLANMDDGRWNMAINVNLQSALRISEAFLEVTGKGGRVVCLSSIAGIAGNFGQTNYGAAKSGVMGMVSSLAPEFAKKGATINAIAPGFIETRLTAAIPFFTREAGRRMSALGQGGLPLDVAEAITFLSLPGSAGVNGQTIRVCGLNFIGA